MTDAPSLLADLLAECDALGVRLTLAGDGRLTIDAPQDALTPDFLAQLTIYKPDLLALLGSSTGEEAQQKPAPKKEADALAKPVCRCGSTAWLDVPIHDGQSVRRDCARCRRFLDFPTWYGQTSCEQGTAPGPIAASRNSSQSAPPENATP